MIKKRTRPQPRIREPSPPEVEEEENEVDEHGEVKLPLADLLELRKLKKARQGIDASKLSKGDTKRRRKKPVEEVDEGGLKKGVVPTFEEDEDEEAAEREAKDAKARRAIRSNNFTGQTNALDVDKHMMAYIEENLKIRSKPKEDDEKKQAPADPQEALYQINDRWKVNKQKPTTDNEGSVTNSLTMLTAIPEVDLGMDARLKNIEETEKAKRVVAEERHDRKRGHDEDVPSRFYRANHKAKSDADILRDAKLEAMGLPPQEDQPRRSNNDKVQMATDEVVMERFKKRMRK